MKGRYICFNYCVIWILNGYRCVTLVSLENSFKKCLKRYNVEELTT